MSENAPSPSTASTPESDVDLSYVEMSEGVKPVEPAEGPGITYPVDGEPWKAPESPYISREQKMKEETEEAELARAEHLKRIEASIVLEGSQKLDKYIIENADSLVKKGEKVASAIGDKKFELKDKYLQMRIDGVKSKKERLEKKSQNAIFEFRRQKFARKARLSERRLKGLMGFQSADRKSHSTAVGSYNTETGKINPDGSRTKRREARVEQVQSKINRMIAAEYKFAKLAREDRKKLKDERKHPDTSPHRRAELRKLLVETGSVESLEALGRKEFIRRVMEVPAIRDPAIRLINQFVGAIEANNSSPNTQSNHDLVA